MFNSDVRLEGHPDYLSCNPVAAYGGTELFICSGIGTPRASAVFLISQVDQ
jgi:hypothetical protein